jgi:hypothetical protein
VVPPLSLGVWSFGNGGGAKEEGLKVKFGRSVVFYQLKGGAVELDDAVDRLFTRYKAPSPGRFHTVTETRVKVRQLPGE